MKRYRGLTDAQWEQLQRDTERQLMQRRWWIDNGRLVETVRAPLSETEKNALDAWWIERRGAPTAQERTVAMLQTLAATEDLTVTRQIGSYPSEPPRLEALSIDWSRIRLDCLRPFCEGEVVVLVNTRGSVYTLEHTCPDCQRAYRPGEEATVLRLAKEFHDNDEPSEAALVAYSASGDEPGEIHDRQARLMLTVKA